MSAVGHGLGPQTLCRLHSVRSRGHPRRDWDRNGYGCSKERKSEFSRIHAEEQRVGADEE